MRHYAGVKVILCLPLFFAAYASADEAADLVAIGRAISKLNELPRPTGLFTEDANASSELEGLPKVNPLAFRMAAFRILEPPSDPVFLLQADHPTVTISHEPWGEATIDFPCTEYLIKALRARTLEILNPRIGSRTIRFLTPDVALVDGAWTYKDDGATTRTTLLLFVMKKERGNWKIASIRVLAPAP
jgi:hypothetical protein